MPNQMNVRLEERIQLKTEKMEKRERVLENVRPIPIVWMTGNFVFVMEHAECLALDLKKNVQNYPILHMDR